MKSEEMSTDVAPPTFDEWTKDKPQIVDPCMPISLKHKMNIDIETANIDSRETTWLCINQPAKHPHLGARIRPLYAYTETEKKTLLHDKSLDWNKLPSFLRTELSLRLAEEKTQAEQMGDALKLGWATEPSQQTPLSQYLEPATPPLYRAMLLAGCRIPLTWFIDHYMELACDVARLVTKDVTLLTKEDKLLTVTVIDVERMLRERAWPDDLGSHSLTLSTWQSARENFLRVCHTLADPGDATDGKTNITAELTRHFAHFAQELGTEYCVNCDYMRNFGNWYPVERALRMEIFQKRVFNRDVWQNRVIPVMDFAEPPRPPARTNYNNPNQAYSNNHSGSRKRRHR